MKKCKYLSQQEGALQLQRASFLYKENHRPVVMIQQLTLALSVRPRRQSMDTPK
jgi:hypothetical protein